ncbi:MAG TPA: hypothetical protein VN428_24105 [Bryobacteraceae bacterium]|nr:hypothetical protein [Bryobacteraceae bacterium]
MRLRVAVLSLAVLSVGYADSLTLRNGRTVQGSYLGGNSRQVRMAVGDRIESYDIAEVEAIRFETAQASSATPAPAVTTMPAQAEPAVAPAAASTAAPVQAATAATAPVEPEPPRRGVLMRPQTAATASVPAVAATPASAAVSIPVGTQVTIRMIDDVDSQTAQVGQTYRASVDEPVVIDGRTVIPRGADVITKLVEFKEAGRIAGGGQLTLDLASITINGQRTDVISQSVTQAGESGKRDSAAVIGGTTVLGAVIGAIAGGGKGAAIGAVSGAGAGTAIRVMTKGTQVRIPSETRLTFTLQQALRIP